MEDLPGKGLHLARSLVRNLRQGLPDLLAYMAFELYDDRGPTAICLCIALSSKD